MADKLEEIYQAFVTAMDSYNTAVEAMNASVGQLKVAERQLSKAFDEFTSYMGAQGPYDAEPDKHGGDPFSLFNRISQGSGGFGGFIDDIGSLF